MSTTTTEYSLTRLMSGAVLALCVLALGLVALLQPSSLAPLAGVLVPVAMGALSVLGGSYAISRGVAKRGAPKDSKDGGFARPALLGLLAGALALLSLTGCGTTIAQRMALVATGTQAAWTRAYPVIDLACKAEARKCAKPGVKVELSACPGADKCLKALKVFQASLDTADRALLVGLPLAAAGDSGASKYLTAALAAYNQALAAATEWGLKPSGGK